MRGNTIGIELESEDIELLTRIERETGKSIHQLAGEAIKNTYNTKYKSNDDDGTALLEAIDKIGKQVQQVKIAVERQRQEIELFSNSSKKHLRQSTPPPA
ncbi:hypothetical protein H6G17_19025 [Chroococcidiopsis sp. FACHB-1243]|uniref:hypothetical protein n=1 Tax=Chroococcidiopsis sp. [FACHB-1243] TaxID=2692781 RepID=UPI00178172D9|nr:hypothetical protein [Chroococcidiopsis sp. [FACHB-1243]]MBD2307567.1 hypothetical protein [Chroococcidiopsis sp. [FACHB-1243]]